MAYPRALLMVHVLASLGGLRAQPCAVPPTCVVNRGLEAEPGNDMNIGEPYDVDGWSVSHGNPSIFGNDAPSDDSGSSIWMWSYSRQGEGIMTCIDLRAGVEYELCLWVRNTNAVAQNGRLQIWMVDEVTPAPDNPFVVMPSQLDGELVDSSWVNSPEWTALTVTMTPTVDRSRLLLFPYMAGPLVGGALQYELQVDDVRVSPLLRNTNLSLGIAATRERIGWCDSTELCVTGLPATIPVEWSPAPGLVSATGACATAAPCSTTTYTATVRVPAGCPNSCSPAPVIDPLSITIEVDPPTVEVNTLGPVRCGSAQLIVASIPNDACVSGGAWRSAPGTRTQGDSLIVAEVGLEHLGPYVYEVVHASAGCLATSEPLVLRPEGTVAEVYLPNAFSPNGDGINDVFTAASLGFADFELTIYDRWGRALHNTTDAVAGWDGNAYGEPVPGGVYAYELRHTLACATDAERRVGHVTLLR